MALLEDLIENVGQHEADVRETVVGRFWTLVASSACGIASLSQSARPANGQEGADTAGKTTKDLLKLAFSQNPREASLGIATLNSLIIGQVNPRHFKPYRIPTARDKKIVVVGEFPFTDHLKTIAQDVSIVEKNPESGDYAGEEAEQAFRDADVALLAGARMVDHTLETLLTLAGPCYTIVYGPSTPLSPILFSYGADQLVGVRVTDEQSAKKCVAEGMRNLSECPGVAPVVMEAGQHA
jgi:uncharacterized protein (DUF4213/DUF364 family)